MTTIYVTNNSDISLVDGWDGVQYTFKPGSTVEIPLSIAKHIFGYGDEHKEPYLARLGWIKSKNDLQDGLSILAKWDLSTEAPKKDRVLSPVVERVPLPVEKQVRGKVLTAVK
jgi:hypothetical protein